MWNPILHGLYRLFCFLFLSSSYESLDIEFHFCVHCLLFVDLLVFRAFFFSLFISCYSNIKIESDKSSYTSLNSLILHSETINSMRFYSVSSNSFVHFVFGLSFCIVLHIYIHVTNVTM